MKMADDKPPRSLKDIPKVNDLTKEELLEIYKDELKRKDEIIERLDRENKLLLDLTMKNAKRRLEESETKISINKKIDIKNK
jgi:hypothetical protein